MAISAATCWRIRPGGSASNGGGYDSTISGAGTDYTDQDAAQLSLTDLATSGAGSTTLTSATGGFTSAMVGNCLRIASGTNFQTGYYFVTAYTDANTVTVDRTPTSGGAGSGGVGALGGAWATFQNMFTGTGSGSMSQPAVSSPVQPGNTVYVAGSGSSNPGSADYSYDGYYSFGAASSTTAGETQIIGYHGRPRIDVAGGLFNGDTKWSFRGLHFKYTTDAGYPMLSVYAMRFIDCWFDQAGYDIGGVFSFGTERCWFFNSGSTAAGTESKAAITVTTIYGSQHFGNTIDGWKGAGVYQNGNSSAQIIGNLIANCKRSGIYLLCGSGFNSFVLRNTIYNCDGGGIKLPDATSMQYSVGTQNLIVGNGAYGIDDNSGGSAALNSRLAGYRWRENAFYGNTSGEKRLMAGVDDIALTGDPFVNAGSGDFSLNSTSGAGADCRSAGYPGTMPDGVTVGYADIGAIQHQDSGGGGGGGGPLIGGRLVL